MQASNQAISRRRQKLHLSANQLPEEARMAVIAELNSNVCDTIDLMTHIKMAHWNLKGPTFAAVHPLLDTFAEAMIEHGDEMAERATSMGGHIYATARHVAANSRLTEYPQDTTLDLEHVKHLSERFKECIKGLHQTLGVAAANHDDASVELVTGVIIDLEQKAWFLLAHLDN